MMTPIDADEPTPRAGDGLRRWLLCLACALPLAIAAVQWPVLAMPVRGHSLPAGRAFQDASATPAARSFEWSRIDIALEIGERGAVHVTERMEVTFQGGPFRSGFREIPLSRGERIRNVSVAEERDGQALSFAEVHPPIDRDTPGTYTVQLPDTVGVARIEWTFPATSDASRVFALTYDFDGAVEFIPRGEPRFQELTWIAVDRELSRAGPVKHASITVHLPPTVDGSQVEGLARFGKQHAVVSEDRRTWTWSVSDLSPGEELVIRMRIPLAASATPVAA